MDAILIATSLGYTKYTNALLNSLVFRRLHERLKFDVHIQAYCDLVGHPWLEHIQRAYPFKVYVTIIEASDFGLPVREACQTARYKTLEQLGKTYDVCCLLDADMFLVSQNFANLFDLVRGTKNAIGCNERCKWTMTDHYQLFNKPIFDKPVSLDKFHCNVPLILRPSQWGDVFAEYHKLAFIANEYRGDEIKPVGDMFGWNIAVQKCNRQNDIVLFPMEVMTQVHLTHVRPWTQLKKHGGYWYSAAGDEVFTVHGKPDHMVNVNAEYYKEHDINHEVAKHVVGLIVDEWNMLNNGLVKLHEFFPNV